MNKNFLSFPIINLFGQISGWLGNIFLIYLLITLPLLALIFRYQDAAWTLTWGSQRVACGLPIISGYFGNCSTFYNYLSQSDKPVNFGIYDPEQKFDNSENIAIDHYYLQWHTYVDDQLLPQLQATQSRNRWPLITVEPFHFPNLSPENLFSDILAGLYDDPINAICSDLRQFNQPAFFRWGHEMENVTGRYPWASKDFQGYIRSYQYVVNKCRNFTDQLYYVWSPVGDSRMEFYWPGNEYVDYVGISLYTFPAWERDYYGRVRTARQHLWEKYQRVKIFQHPVMIAEMGAVGDSEFQTQWLMDIVSHLEEFPLLKTMVYFNAPDTPGVWGDYPTPDWRLYSF